MARFVQWLLVGWFLMLAIWMFFSPMSWYQTTPGVVDTGPFNMHFVMDIGLVFLMSAGALAYGLRQQNQTAIICGAVWPALHAAFHIYIWFERGIPFDLVALSNLVGIQLPAWTALLLALSSNKRSIRYA